MEIVGYADRLRAQPGETISFMVSCQAPSFRAQLVRVAHGDDNPDGPGSKLYDLDSAANCEFPGRVQELHPGSFDSVPDDPRLRLGGSFTIAAWIYPTTLEKGLQGVVTKWDCDAGIGYGLFVDELGAASLRVGDGDKIDAVSTGVAMQTAKWYFAAGTYDADDGSLRVSQTPLDHWPFQDTAAEAEGTASGGPGQTGAALVIGGASCGENTGIGTVGCLYNGKVDNPTILGRALGTDEVTALRQDRSSVAGDDALVAAWDFGRDFSTYTVTDCSPNALHGEALNMPVRAVTSHNWRGRVMDFKLAPDQYAAIRFNDDDLDDARWDVDFDYTVPEDLKSAMYAFRLTTEDAEDYIPFAVRPRNGEPTAKIAFLLGTYTFLAYANEHLANNPVLIEYLEGKGMQLEFPLLPHEHYMVDNKLGGLYDLHTDGSGICYSSSRKPIVNFRPNNKQRTVGAGLGAPVLLSADLHQMDWMESQGFDFDVITDEDIHFDRLGPALRVQRGDVGCPSRVLDRGHAHRVGGLPQRGGSLHVPGGQRALLDHLGRPRAPPRHGGAALERHRFVADRLCGEPSQHHRGAGWPVEVPRMGAAATGRGRHDCPGGHRYQLRVPAPSRQLRSEGCVHLRRHR